MVILCLCREEHDWKLIPGYAAAFRRHGIEFLSADDKLPFDASIDEVLRTAPQPPSFIFHFESDHPLLPIGLQHSPVPTVCFHPDTYAYTDRRIQWSSLFDHAVVFHPGYVERFAAAGHPGAVLLPHAVRREFYDLPEELRESELGWVGQTTGPLYQTRADWFPRLRAEFRMNDWSRRYTIEEAAGVYRRSRIVVNIGRDDFPEDANLRVFEVLASGALLITALPTELTELGFVDGVHFVGYRHPTEISALVRKYLADEPGRRRIAESARCLTLAEHTYDSRVAQLLSRLSNPAQRRFAPARSWPESHARLAALDFYAANNLTSCAITQWRYILRHGFRETLPASSLILRLLARSLRPK